MGPNQVIIKCTNRDCNYFNRENFHTKEDRVDKGRRVTILLCWGCRKDRRIDMGPALPSETDPPKLGLI